MHRCILQISMKGKVELKGWSNSNDNLARTRTDT